MDAALSFNPTTRGYDVSVAGGDLVAETSLRTAAIVSLLSDALADEGDTLLNPGERRGYWADALAVDGDSFGARIWLLARSKQLPKTMLDAQSYCEQALAWMVADGFATAVAVTVSNPRMGWLVAGITITLQEGGALRLRLTWDDAGQWTLDGEEH